jgi:hypothetical protein
MHGTAPETTWSVLAVSVGVSVAALLVVVGLLIHGV